MDEQTFEDHLKNEHKSTAFTEYLQEFVYGGVDGIVTTFAVVAGFSGASMGEHALSLSVVTVLLFGLANLIADGAAMGLGNFLSVRSQQHLFKRTYEKERYEIMHSNKFELQETVYILEEKGYEKNDAKALTALLAKNPDSTGSLGIAISEAVEKCVSNSDTKYALGSVLNHVLTHQTIIGQEAMEQLSSIDEYPDTIVGCTGGGSNFAGIAFPFLGKSLRNKENIELRAIEPSACPSLTKGKFAYDFGDTGGMTPLVKMHTLGSNFVPSGFHAGGLRYHGMAPIVSHLVNNGYVNPESYTQLDVFKAGILFAKYEGIIPAPEANHAVKGAIEAALRAKESGESKTILFNLCGHGNFDMQAYIDYFDGKLFDQEYSDEEIGMALSGLPSV